MAELTDGDVQQVIADFGIMHEIAHGDANKVVETENGPVRSIAKLIADNQALIEAQAPSLAQLATPGGAGIVGFAGRTVEDKLQEVVSLADKDGGPAATGSENDTALADAFASQKSVHMGYGTISFSSPISFAQDQAINGDGRRATTIKFPAGQNGVAAYPTSTGRNAVGGVRIESDGLTKSGGIGLNTENSSFGIYRDYSVWGFDVGLQDNGTAGTSSFSARNLHYAFELNSNNTGIKAYGSNANTYMAGRLWNNGVGIDMNDAEALGFYGLNIEASTGTAIKSRNSSWVAVGLYGEVGAEPGRQNFDFDAQSVIRTLGLKINGKRGVVETWNPNTSRWHLDAPDTSSNQALLTDISAASVQYIRNPDFSRGLSAGWTAAGGLAATIEAVDFESGTQAADLAPSSASSYFETSFNVERDAKVFSVGIRFKPKGAGTFRVNIVNDGVVKAQYSYVSGAAATEYLTGTITAGLVNSIDTTKPIYVRVYPDVVGGTSAVLLDQIWAVRGYWVSSPRGYASGVDLLEVPQVLVSKSAVTANQTDSVTPANVPSMAKGMRVRLRVSGTAAATNDTRVAIFGKSIELWAVRNGQIAVGEFSLVGTGAISIQAFVGSSSNSVTYSAEIVEWII